MSSKLPERRSLKSYFAVVMVVAMIVSVASAGAAGAAGGPEGASDLDASSTEFSSTATQSESKNVSFAYVDGSDSVVTVVYEDGTEALTGVQAELVGGVADIDDDGVMEAPYVNGNGDLGVVEAEADAQGNVLTTSAAQYSKSHIGTGDWDGDGTERIFYVDSDGHINAVDANGNVETILPNVSAKGVAGIADFTGDGDKDIVFVDSNQEVAYFDNGSVTSTGTQVGQNNGLGVGAPADFDGDGNVRVPYVDTSENVKLVNVRGSSTSALATGADKSPLAPADHVDNGNLDVLYTEGGNGKYVTLSENTGSLDVGAKQNAGIAKSDPAPPFEVRNFTLMNGTGQNITVSFESAVQLQESDVSIEDPDGNIHSLSHNDFEKTSDGWHEYTAEFEGTLDGQYNGTLETVVSDRGTELNPMLTDSTSVSTAAPSVHNLSVSSEDGDSYVNDEETVNITVDVQGATGDVTADASAIGGPSDLNLTSLGDETYSAETTVDAETVDDGEKRISITAVNGETSDTETGTITLDTTAPTNPSSGTADTTTVGQSVSFDVSDADSPIESAQWDFGDGSSASGASVSHTYDAPGTYNVTVTATDAAGNELATTFTIAVDEADTDYDDGPDGDGDADLPANVAERHYTIVDGTATVELPGGDVDTVAFEDAQADGFVIVDRLKGLPEGVDRPSAVADGELLELYDVTVPDETTDSEATVEFVLDASRLGDDTAEDVVVYHRDGGEWSALDTTAAVEGSDLVVEAETDEFSAFAVTTSGPPSTATETTAATDPVTETATATETDTPTETVAEGTVGGEQANPGTGFSTAGIVGAVLLVALLTATVVVVRRRQ